MPRIIRATLARVEGRTVDAEVTIAWSPIERVTPYIVRFDFHEQDSWFRGGDDRLEISDQGISDTDKPSEATYPFRISGTVSWNNEKGNEEIYARVSVFPDNDLVEVPGTSVSRTNVIVGKFP